MIERNHLEDIAKRQKLIEIEQREHAEYERLKAKYELSDYNAIEL